MGTQHGVPAAARLTASLTCHLPRTRLPGARPQEVTLPNNIPLEDQSWQAGTHNHPICLAPAKTLPVWAGVQIGGSARVLPDLLHHSA
jgi:hypothetical protein